MSTTPEVPQMSTTPEVPQMSTTPEVSTDVTIRFPHPSALLLVAYSLSGLLLSLPHKVSRMLNIVLYDINHLTLDTARGVRERGGRDKEGRRGEAQEQRVMEGEGDEKVREHREAGGG